MFSVKYTISKIGKQYKLLGQTKERKEENWDSGTAISRDHISDILHAVDDTLLKWMAEAFRQNWRKVKVVEVASYFPAVGSEILFAHFKKCSKITLIAEAEKENIVLTMCCDKKCGNIEIPYEIEKATFLRVQKNLYCYWFRKSEETYWDDFKRMVLENFERKEASHV